MDLIALERLGEDRHGLVVRADATKAGMSRTDWYRTIARGHIEQLHPGVARLRGAPVTREQRILAAVLAAGDGAMASHRSAAHLWGVPRPDDDPIDVLVPDRNRGVAVEGALVHRPRDRRDLNVVRRAGVPTSNVLRTLCDLGAFDAGAVHDAVGHVLATKHATLAALHRAVRTHGRRGRPGVPALREALDAWAIDGKPADSILEPATRDLLRRHGLPPVEFHPRIDRYEVDFRILDSPIVLECDGWTAHALDRANWERDKRRDADLAALGFVTVRFTYRMVVRTPKDLARRIRRIVEQWAPHLLGGSRPST